MRLTSDIEDEVDAIRDQIYDETKNMTPTEHVAYFNVKTEEARKRGIRVVSSAVGDTTEVRAQ